MELGEFQFLMGGIIVTFLLSIFELFHNRSLHKKTIYINTVTAERIKWIEGLRNNISEFCGLTLHWIKTRIDKSKEQEILERIDILRTKIKLQINPHEQSHKEIINLIDLIPNLTDQNKADELENKVSELTNKTQKILKEVWDKIRQESKMRDLT